MKMIEQRQTPNSRRVRVFMAEKGVALPPLEQIDIMTLGAQTPEFTAQNPMQAVPVLVLDNGHIITESVAICRYFEETNPQPALFGTGAEGRATVEMWNRRMELGLLTRVAQAFRHLHPAMAQLEVPQVKEWGEGNKAKLGGLFEMMDAQLAHHTFIAGDTISIADITAMIAIDFMKPIKVERPAHLAHLDRWYKAMAARPSAKA
jgi:glutathione S-transferase